MKSIIKIASSIMTRYYCVVLFSNISNSPPSISHIKYVGEI